MRIAVEGCCHGELDTIYGTLKLLEQRENVKINLLLICGDFQVRCRSSPSPPDRAVPRVETLDRVSAPFAEGRPWRDTLQSIRNTADMDCLACPQKYRQLGTFYQYYTGEKKAPYPTLFIGGNHEASNYLWELYHGGWVAPNIYFLGYAGVIGFGGLKIAGISGIYKCQDYDRAPIFGQRPEVDIPRTKIRRGEVGAGEEPDRCVPFA
ncbi:MAG: hypothetical protein BJ554DRAFT_5287 [Olpidium bornovanus]|uniref:Calcineurin-like phosphoesterase domain-containing protein n=1 Tax=Olpidium bornovanus TaxID=278681 RepID=A0A8H8A0G9_9FUNG|nr:MAG: hypothetical protein BJ554DRAFT_5287 [Olpidium bornovanus]